MFKRHTDRDEGKKHILLFCNLRINSGKKAIQNRTPLFVSYTLWEAGTLQLILCTFPSGTLQLSLSTFPSGTLQLSLSTFPSGILQLNLSTFHSLTLQLNLSTSPIGTLELNLSFPSGTLEPSLSTFPSGILELNLSSFPSLLLVRLNISRESLHAWRGTMDCVKIHTAGSAPKRKQYHHPGACVLDSQQVSTWSLYSSCPLISST